MLLIFQTVFTKVHIIRPHFYTYSYAHWIVCENFLPKTAPTFIIKQLTKVLKQYSKEGYIGPTYDPLLRTSKAKQRKLYNYIMNPTIYPNFRFYDAQLYQLGKHNLEAIKRLQKLKTPAKNSYILTLLNFYQNYSESMPINHHYLDKYIIKYLKHQKPLSTAKKAIFINITNENYYLTLLTEKPQVLYLIGANSQDTLNYFATNHQKIFNANTFLTYPQTSSINFIQAPINCAILNYQNNRTYTPQTLQTLWNILTPKTGKLYLTSVSRNNVSLDIKCFMNSLDKNDYTISDKGVIYIITKK